MHPNADTIAELVEVIWRRRDLDALDRFWSADCVNHAAGPSDRRGLDALARYHRSQFAAFVDFHAPTIDIVQQVADDDGVATHLVTTATHGPTDRSVTMTSMRFDRMRAGKVVEHWSVADQAGLLAQLQA